MHVKLLIFIEFEPSRPCLLVLPVDKQYTPLPYRGNPPPINEELIMPNESIGAMDAAGTESPAVEQPTGLQIASRLHTQGATQIDVNLSNLADAVNSATARLMSLAINSEETMEQIQTRLEGSRETDDYSLRILHKAQQTQTSYDAEQRSREGQAAEHTAVEQRRYEGETRQAYETAVSGAVTVAARKHRVSREKALEIVEKEIAILGIDSALPVFSRVLKRYTDAQATQNAPAPTAVELAKTALARAEADEAGRTQP